ncbi:methyltransferase domain-containing protein [Venatoribacter cucullus]|uniref:methyltransferase domain-containing protein n=1 Tax=Venatoribacter cucullus TaxID=2661630 RepID=UPI0022405BB8|nr:methyltransferase domain-containing protein [Venatoribacter cucullus]UZK04340.1 methyltransferase domain-containing protein [Venatoribacter cucullus]
MKPTVPDRNFDNLASRFARTIYATPRGRIRLAALAQDFAELNIPLAQARVLDIGGGQGQFALQLAKQGAMVDLCDISAEMLRLAQDQFAAAGQPLNSRHCGLQQAADYFPATYDIVLNHAVLEWLEEPLAALPILAQQVKPGGWLSLMFYNRDGHIWRQLMNGGFTDPLRTNTRLRDEGNAPQHPLNPDIVEQQLNALGFSVQRWRGIRCIYDHLAQKIRDREGEEAVTRADLEYGTREPFRRLGRYVHFLAQKKAKEPLNNSVQLCAIYSEAP